MSGNSTLQESLLELERGLLSPQVRRSGERMRRLLADEFVEFGSSGHVYDRESIIESLAASDGTEAFNIEDFRLVTSGAGTAFVTYRCVARSTDGKILRKANRSSLWQRIDGRWQLVFHQGTRAQ